MLTRDNTFSPFHIPGRRRTPLHVASAANRNIEKGVAIASGIEKPIICEFVVQAI
jgi:hypothetical protein